MMWMLQIWIDLDSPVPPELMSAARGPGHDYSWTEDFLFVLRHAARASSFWRIMSPARTGG
jgi:hypothetical protein